MKLKLMPLRYDAEKVDPRVERLLAELGAREEFDSFKLTSSAVLRMAVLEGLSALEARYGLA